MVRQETSNITPLSKIGGNWPSVDLSVKLDDKRSTIKVQSPKQSPSSGRTSLLHQWLGGFEV